MKGKLFGCFFIFILTTTVCAEERERRVEYPSDLGTSTIDVSSYPARFQKIYSENFLKNCAVCHNPARAIHSEYLEVKDDQRAALEKETPGLFDDPRVLRPGPHLWKHYIKRMKMRPPCCGVCPVMTDTSAREIWEFLVYDSLIRKTGAHAAEWRQHRQDLLNQFKSNDPDRYRELYESQTEEQP